MPIWDDRIPQPDSGFTTRFDLSSRLDEDADLGSDLACLVHDDDLTLLAILAAAKLKRLDRRNASRSTLRRPDRAACSACCP